MSSTAYDTWLVGLREHNDQLPSIEEQQALLDFLNQKTTAEEAALAYTNNVVNTKYQDPWSLWFLLRLAAERWLETHPRLVELLKAIKRLPRITQTGRAGKTLPLDYWSVLPDLERLLSMCWERNVDRLVYNLDPNIDAAAVINLTSFTARLFCEQVLHSEAWAIMPMKWALERDHKRHPHLLDTFIQAAAQYILLAGPAVYKCDREGICAGSLLEKARGEGGVERWGFWKERFKSMQDREDLEDGTRAVGKQVADRMEEIEREPR